MAQVKRSKRIIESWIVLVRIQPRFLQRVTRADFMYEYLASYTLLGRNKQPRTRTPDRMPRLRIPLWSLVELCGCPGSPARWTAITVPFETDPEPRPFTSPRIPNSGRRADVVRPRSSGGIRCALVYQENGVPAVGSTPNFFGTLSFPQPEYALQQPKVAINCNNFFASVAVERLVSRIGYSLHAACLGMTRHGVVNQDAHRETTHANVLELMFGWRNPRTAANGMNNGPRPDAPLCARRHALLRERWVPQTRRALRSVRPIGLFLLMLADLPAIIGGGSVAPEKHLADAEPADERDYVPALEGPAGVLVSMVQYGKDRYPVGRRGGAGAAGEKDISLQDEGGYFMDDILRVTTPDFVPTDSDILRARIKRMGVEEHLFEKEPTSGNRGVKDFWIYDLPGSRGARARWIPFFDMGILVITIINAVQAIVFLTPLSFYEVLDEDTRVNRLEDSVVLWKEICSNTLLQNGQIILFFNKVRPVGSPWQALAEAMQMDILKAKLRAGLIIKEYVTSFGDRPNTYVGATSSCEVDVGGWSIYDDGSSRILRGSHEISVRSGKTEGKQTPQEPSGFVNYSHRAEWSNMEQDTDGNYIRYNQQMPRRGGMPRLVIDIAPLCLTMSTPNAQAPKPLKGLRKLALRHNQPPRIAPSPEPPEMKTEWIEPLLTTARLGAALGEACPIPYVKGAFNITVFFLESVREGLKDLCTDIVELLKIIEPYILTQSSNVEHKLRELCKDFEKFMHSLQDMVHGIQKQDNSTQGKIRAFFQTDTTREQLATHNEQLKSFMARIQLLATLDIHHHVISATASEVLSEISSCPPASRIFHGRQIILESMEQFFASNQSEQQIYVLYGLGGSGKTQIALKFIEQPKARFTHKFFVDASSPETITNNFKMITSMLNIPEETVGGAMSWLASKFEEWLLLFDNADDTNLGLNDFFPQCKHGNIIITTRNPELRVYGAYSQVSNMEEDDAVQLLLMSAAQELCCFPLAIIQAGAYIAKSQDLAGYLGLYADNRVQLLSRKLVQSHDKYAWTVYTTWQLSFERLGQVAQEFLMLCSHLHHEGISENIFKSASVYVCTKQWPSEPDLVVCKKFLAHFYGLDSRWSSMKFRDVVNEILSFSLMDFNPGRQVLSMHPLVHRWCSEVVADSALYNNCIHGVLGMCIGATSELHHLGNFRQEYARVYYWAGYHNKARQLQLNVLAKCYSLLGEHHPDTLTAMAHLAITHRQLGELDDAKALEIDVLAKRHNLLGEHHPDTLTAMANLAYTHTELGKLVDAKSLEIEVVAKHHNLLGEHHPDTLTAMQNLANTHRQLGELNNAKGLEIDVLAKRHNLLGEHHRDTLTAMQSLAITQAGLGELDNAKALEIDVLAKHHNLLGEHHPDTLTAMQNLAVIHVKRGELDDAKALEIDIGFGMKLYHVIKSIFQEAFLSIMAALCGQSLQNYNLTLKLLVWLNGQELMLQQPLY
ncbi:G-protein alpha subunit-domain-containing protein [Mycena pura]|uniref:G-protein alpha subunit-domain-containing protein n=1 Tax=Mycena pura TaxID=153505 RepID=A0AAD6UMW4_9AGAR|nr:G-protein alpha subunit-domain-containing protein [Mycena pura]